jgi:MoxR-like ATPase
MNTAILQAVWFTPAGRRANGEWVWGLPIIYWGKPGIGKSSIVGQVARICGLSAFVVIASIREPADFLGLPMPVGGKLSYLPPAWARDAAECDMAVVLLDEVTTCSPATQAALLRVVLDRVVGDLQLPGGVRVVCAANPRDVAIGGRDLGAPLANRLLHDDLDGPSPDAWRAYMIGGGGDTAAEQNLDPVAEQDRVLARWREDYAWARGLWSAFVRQHPQALNGMPKPGDPQASRAWGSPRSLEMAARVTASARTHGLDDIDADQMLTMAVGPLIAGQFALFRHDTSMPDLPDWLDGKVTWEPDPTRPDRTYAVFDGAAALIQPRASTPAEEQVRARRAAALWAHMRPLVDTTPDIAVTAGITLTRAGFASGPEATAVMAALLPIVKAAGMLKV